MPYSALRIKSRFADFDAEQRFEIPAFRLQIYKACECGAILRGIKHPRDCKIFGTACTPDNPVGSCMVSSEKSVVLNPRYKSTVNLYGSECWACLLPKRVDPDKAAPFTQNRLPISSSEACDMRLIDDCIALDRPRFIGREAEQRAHAADYTSRLQQKVQRCNQDERQKPLQQYCEEELQHMQRNFYGFDPSYHVARHHFVCKIPHVRMPLYLAGHQRI
ncbi:hydrogenase expression/formation protein HypD [Nitrosomonas sp. Nm51]|nr:hydrogenase expression/formation protein HypD [Nitrosomonas sp. Nm51]